MKLKLQIIGNEKVLFEVPLALIDWQQDQLEYELGSLTEEYQRFSKLFIALSNETRLMMMRRLMEEEDHTVNFTDFMKDLDMNPKLVRDNARKLSDSGLVEKVGRGRYRCSKSGEPSFIMVSLALRRLMKELEEF